MGCRLCHTTFPIRRSYWVVHVLVAVGHAKVPRLLVVGHMAVQEVILDGMGVSCSRSFCSPSRSH